MPEAKHHRIGPGADNDPQSPVPDQCPLKKIRGGTVHYNGVLFGLIKGGKSMLGESKHID
jgi:hypothetical protein